LAIGRDFKGALFAFHLFGAAARYRQALVNALAQKSGSEGIYATCTIPFVI
jgi:hypothetical protein